MKRAPNEVVLNIIGPPESVARVINQLAASTISEQLKKCEELVRRAEEAAEKAQINAESAHYRK